jgi:hypothetical protein
MTPPEKALDSKDDWIAALAMALDETGGPITDEERAWADAVLRSPSADEPSSASQLPLGD